VETILDGVANGKRTTYDSSFKTIIAEGVVTPKGEKEGTFFESIPFSGGVASITTFVKNEITEKVWFDEASETILAIGKYKNGKPFNGYFMGFTAKNGTPPPLILNVHHFKDGKKIEILSGKNYYAQNKATHFARIFAPKIKTKPTPPTNRDIGVCPPETK